MSICYPCLALPEVSGEPTATVRVAGWQQGHRMQRGSGESTRRLGALASGSASAAGIVSHGTPGGGDIA